MTVLCRCAIKSMCENDNTNIEPDTTMALKYYLTLTMAKITNPDSNILEIIMNN